MSEGLGLGSSGFVERHGLYSDEQVEATAEVASRVEELGLRTVRLVLVDQHGVPRSKHLSGEGAIAAMRSGADFSGAIFSLDTGNRVFPPSFVQGGGFGIDEFTGYPDVVIVPDPTTFRVLPWADRTGWMICDVYFAGRQSSAARRPRAVAHPACAAPRGGLRVHGGPRGRVLHHAARASRHPARGSGPGRARARTRGRGLPAGLSVLVRRAARRRRRHARGDPRRALGSRPAAAIDRGRVGAWPDRVHVRADGGTCGGRRDDPVPQRGEGDLQPARAACLVHVLAGAIELLPERVAPPRVARGR